MNIPGYLYRNNQVMPSISTGNSKTPPHGNVPGGEAGVGVAAGSDMAVGGIGVGVGARVLK